MSRSKLTSGGQITVPAEVRKRWRTRTVSVEDHGEHIVVRPAPEDPVAAVRGIFAGRGSGLTSEELMRELREEEAEAEARKWSDS